MILNPFKLWGSYVGLVAGVVVGILIYQAFQAVSEFINLKSTAYLFLIGVIILGFVVGWLVHLSAQREVEKKRRKEKDDKTKELQKINVSSQGEGNF